MSFQSFLRFNTLMPGGTKKVTHTSTNLQLSAAGQFRMCGVFVTTRGLKLLILICALHPHSYRRCQRKLLREDIYNKKLVISKIDRESKLLYNNVKSNFNLSDFHHVLDISLMSYEKELKEAVVQKCSVKGVLRNFTIFTGKHLCQILCFHQLYQKRDSETGVFL